MVVNLSIETIKISWIALNDAKRNLVKQIDKYSGNKKEIAKYQLAEVEEALSVFNELMHDADKETVNI